MPNRVADSLLPVYKGIKQYIAKTTVVGSDELGLKVNNGNYWSWAWQIGQRKIYYHNAKLKICNH